MEELKRGGPAPNPKKKPNLLVRLLTFLVTLALILGAVALVANYDRLNFDSIKRWFSYRTLERNDSGQAESFPFDGSASDAFAALDGGLLSCSTSGVRLYSGSGALLADRTVPLEHPVVEAMGNFGLVYDAGGRDLFLFSGGTEVFALTQPEEQLLLSAAVNASGWIAVVSQESGYKGAVTVYDGHQSPVVQFSLSSRFVMDAAMAPDNKSVAVLTIGLGADGNFESRVDLYRLDRSSEDTEPDWTCPVGNNAILELRWDSSGIWALGESGVYLVTADGALAGTYDYSGLYLKGFSLGGDSCAALLLGKYRAGSSTELRLAASDGSLRASLSIDEQVLSLSSAGRYVAVLTADRLDIYDQDLNLYSTLEGTQSARRALMRGDGTVMLIGAGTARLYVP